MIDDEVYWTGIKGPLWVQRRQPVDFGRYRDTICQYLWCYVQREPAIPTKPAPASTSATTTAQTSNAPPALAPMPEPSHAEISEAPTPTRNITHRALMEGYES